MQEVIVMRTTLIQNMAVIIFEILCHLVTSAAFSDASIQVLSKTTPVEETAHMATPKMKRNKIKRKTAATIKITSEATPQQKRQQFKAHIEISTM